jgi:hypothetical protein
MTARRAGVRTPCLGSFKRSTLEPIGVRRIRTGVSHGSGESLAVQRPVDSASAKTQSAMYGQRLKAPPKTGHAQPNKPPGVFGRSRIASRFLRAPPSVRARRAQCIPARARRGSCAQRGQAATGGRAPRPYVPVGNPDNNELPLALSGRRWRCEPGEHSVTNTGS